MTPRAIGLVVSGIVSGLLTAWVFRRTVERAALRAAVGRIQAHFLEFRLFFDEPRLIWRAQKALIRANLRVCVLLLWPTLILAIPFAWLMVPLDAMYGIAPLRIGEPAVVTAQLTSALQDGALDAPSGIAVETLPVHIPSERQIAWRIRPVHAVAGDLQFQFGGITLTKAIVAGSPGAFLLRRRDRSPWAFLLHPEEARLPAGGVAWVEIDYPGSSRWWIVWFLAISSASALVFLRWWNVTTSR